MGGSDSGMTTVGELLAERLACSFADGDSFHGRQQALRCQKNILCGVKNGVSFRSLFCVAFEHFNPHSDALTRKFARRVRVEVRQWLAQRMNERHASKSGHAGNTFA
jgi:hypothetical protein